MRATTTKGSRMTEIDVTQRQVLTAFGVYQMQANPSGIGNECTRWIHRHLLRGFLQQPQSSLACQLSMGIAACVSMWRFRTAELPSIVCVAGHAPLKSHLLQTQRVGACQNRISRARFPGHALVESCPHNHTAI